MTLIEKLNEKDAKQVAYMAMENLKLTALVEHMRDLDLSPDEFDFAFGDVIDIMPYGEGYVLIAYSKGDIYAYRKEKDGLMTIINLNEVEIEWD